MRNLFFGVLILWAADGYTQDYKLNYDVYFPFARACSDPPGPPKFQFRLSFNTFNNATVRTIASGDGFVMSIKGVLSIPANEGPIKTIWLYSHRFFPLDASFPRLISNELQRVVYQNPDTLLDVHNTFNSRDINWGCLEICRDPDSPIVINTFTLIPSLSIKFIDKESILPIDDKITLKATAGFPKKPLQMAVRYNRPQTRDGNLERPTTPI